MPFFAMTDQVLAGVIQAIYKYDVSIPAQMGVICISDGHLPYYLKPKITHIRHSGQVVGKAAIDLLFDFINNRSTTLNKHLELETFLVELDSC